MTRLFAGLVTAILLCACSVGEQTIDASSKQSLQASAEKVKAGLPAADGEAFTKAMQIIAMKDIADAIQTDGLLGAAASVSTMDASSQFDRIAATIQGKTGPEIIKIAEDIEASRHKRQIDAVTGEISILETELAAAAAAQAKVQGTLDAVKIAGSRYFWNEDGFIDEPIIQFTITNNAAVAIKRGYFHGILETPGRSVPWVDEDFNYEFPGGLEPGESKDLRLAPGSYGKWGNKELQARDDMVITVTVVDFEGPDGERVVGSTFEIENKKERIKTLNKQLLELQAQAPAGSV